MTDHHKLAMGGRMSPNARAAAEGAADAGASPRGQLEAARSQAGRGQRIYYSGAHQGAKERAKRAKLIAAGKLKAE